ncbi:linear amide C-N hydrolase [Tenuifilum osseticum]|uniref:linear amide C-N hydrolase n=1 Tax=Tenuifilum osseticum TaxID=3374723 RepID=UPI0034E59921
MKFKVIFTTIIFLLINYSGYACTTFVLKDKHGNVSFGKNFDFPIGQGHIHINYKNMKKSAFIRPPEKAFSWVSKYGSITFNQAGKEFPYGGINEKGLVIEQMWLQEAKYPSADNRYGLSELQWIQYHLDNSATVNEVIVSDSLIRISYMATSYIHFLVSDSSGNSATIEYIDGKMIVHQGSDLPYSVLSNCIYQNSLSYKSSVERNDSIQYNDWTKNSSGRFVKVTEFIDNYNGTSNLVDYSFNILENVSQPNTQWTIVYDISNLKIHYKSLLNSTIQIIDLKEIDFACKNQQLYIPIADNLVNYDSFKELTFESNLEIIEFVINGVEFLKNNVPKEFRLASAKYFESVKCSEQ